MNEKLKPSLSIYTRYLSVTIYVRYFHFLLSVPNPDWDPPPNPDISAALVSVRLVLPQPPPFHEKVHRQHRKAISSLSQNPDITIKPADKNLGTCILSTKWYIQECLRQLTNTTTY
jgi:hypothetical protein